MFTGKDWRNTGLSARFANDFLLETFWKFGRLIPQLQAQQPPTQKL
jgi:hypothetical protein